MVLYKRIWRSTNGLKIKLCGSHRVHDVPYKFMNKAVAESICETIGRRIFRRPMRPSPVQRQEGEFSSTVVDQTGEGEAIMEIENSGDDNVEGHLWKAQWKEKPNDEGRKKLTM